MLYNAIKIMKTNVGFTLSPGNVEKIKTAAANEQRSMSQWLDILLTNYFAAKKK